MKLAHLAPPLIIVAILKLLTSKKKIFISFAIEDKSLRDLLVGQGENSNVPFVFDDRSVKEPWDSAWKTKCRTRIKKCDGLVGIVTKNSLSADGQLWEITCAEQESVPIHLIYGHSDSNKRPRTLPAPLRGRSINDWEWKKINKFIKNT